MLILSNTTDSIEVVLGGTVTTTQLLCVSSFRDITTSAYTPNRTVIATNNATPISAVAAPAASTQRVIDLVSVFNTDTVAQTVTIKYNANGTKYTLWSASLDTGESVQFVEGSGWTKLMATGIAQVSPSPAAAGTLTGTVLATNVVTSSLTSLGTIAALSAGTGTFSGVITGNSSTSLATGSFFASSADPSYRYFVSGGAVGQKYMDTEVQSPGWRVRKFDDGLTGATTLLTVDWSGNLSTGSGSISGGAISGTTVTGSSVISTTAGGIKSKGAGGLIESWYDSTPSKASRWQTLIGGGILLGTYDGASWTDSITFTSTGINSTVIGATTPAAGSFTTLHLSNAGFLHAYNSDGTNEAYLHNGGATGANNGNLIVEFTNAGEVARFSNSGLAVTGAVSATTYVKVGTYTVATLPAAGTAGAGSLAYVTDSNATTRLATVAAGGANKVMVFSDGTNWLIL